MIASDTLTWTVLPDFLSFRGRTNGFFIYQRHIESKFVQFGDYTEPCSALKIISLVKLSDIDPSQEWQTLGSQSFINVQMNSMSFWANNFNFNFKTCLLGLSVVLERWQVKLCHNHKTNEASRLHATNISQLICPNDKDSKWFAWIDVMLLCWATWLIS